MQPLDSLIAQRDQAFATALGQVLTRIAGGQDLRSNAGYADALGKFLPDAERPGPRLTEPLQHVPHDRLAVDREIDRLAHALVLERRVRLRVDREEDR